MRSDINGAFDEMVEALEENEDMVECKECFDLFPKADCEKSAVGFICPTCKGRKVMPTRPAFEDPFDCYTQDFPEVSDYDPDSVVEYEVEPSLGDALDVLIKDEYDAINGYEVADEQIQHTDIPEDEKDEILDTLDHIKEEEEEHIDELKELCPECEPEKEDTKENLTESAGEPKIYYIYADDLYVDDLGYMEAMDKDEVIREAEIRYGTKYHPEDLYVEEAEPEILADLVPSDFIIPPKHFKFNEALTEAETPELPEDPEDPEEESEEDENEEVSDLDSAYEAALEVANDKGVGQVFGYATEEDESFVAIDLFDVDDAEAVEDDLRAVYDNVKYAYVAYPEKNLAEALFESVPLTEGPLDFLANKNSAKIFDKLLPSGYIIICTTDSSNRFNKQKIKNYDKAVAALKLAAKTFPKDSFGLTVANTSDLQSADNDIQKLFKDANYTFLFYKNGKVEFGEGKTLAKQVKQLEKAIKKMAKLGGGTSTSTTDRDAATAAVRAGAEETTSETTSETTTDSESESDADADLEDAPEADLEAEEEEKTVEDYRKEALELLGEKKSAEGYTEESYNAYSAKYDDLAKKINGAKKVETFVDKYLPQLPAIVDKMNGLLKPAEDEELETAADTDAPAAEPASEETDAPETDSTETEVDEDSKKKEQAGKIKKGFKDVFAKDISDETAEKLRTILFTESLLHEKIDKDGLEAARDYAAAHHEPRVLAINFVDLYISGTPGTSDGFDISFNGLKGYKAIEAEKDTYTEESFKEYDKYISSTGSNVLLKDAEEEVANDEAGWEDKIVAKLKAAESKLVKKEAVSEATTSEATTTTSEGEGTTSASEGTDATPAPEAEEAGATPARKSKVDVATMNRQRTNGIKLRKAIQSIPELSDIANKLVTVNKKGKKVLTPEARALRKAIFGESLQELT